MENTNTYSNIENLRNRNASDSYLRMQVLYNEIFNNFRNNILWLNPRDLVELTEAFNYARNNGIFSVDHRFEPSKVSSRSLFEKINMASSTIIEGKAVCANISPFYRDMLSSFGINSKCFCVIGNYNPDDLCEKQKQKYFEMERKRLEWQKKVPFIIPNHVLNYVEYNGKKYVVDASNGCIVVPDNGKLLSVHRFKGHKLEYTQKVVCFCNLFYKYATPIDLLKYRFIKPEMSDEEYFDIKEQMILNCEKNNDIFEQIYHTNAPLYEEYIQELENVRSLLRQHHS